jgi:hypothetical protein
MAGLTSIFKATLIFLFLWICSVEAMEKPPHIHQRVWDQVLPYLIPDDHPVKEILDSIFLKNRALLSDKTLLKAGFTNGTPRRWTHVIVTRHPMLPGYIFKMYMDVQRYFKEHAEYDHWIERIEGRNLIESMIDEQGLNHLFKVPKKWIYALPANPAPPKEFIRKNFILVAEDMEILDNDENYAMWKSDKVTKEFLDILYAFLEKGGLRDLAKPANAPFSKDGRVAFIDTQEYYDWPVSYFKLNEHLRPEMLQHWKFLTKKGR